MTDNSGSSRQLLRHTVATLAYRGGKALRGAPDGFARIPRRRCDAHARANSRPSRRPARLGAVARERRAEVAELRSSCPGSRVPSAFFAALKASRRLPRFRSAPRLYRREAFPGPRGGRADTRGTDLDAPPSGGRARPRGELLQGGDRGGTCGRGTGCAEKEFD